MFQILLIRPGSTEYDQQGRVQGTLDIPLCEDGRQEAEKGWVKRRPANGDVTLRTTDVRTHYERRP